MNNNYEDYGILISLVSAPSANTQEYENFYNELFANYRNGLKKQTIYNGKLISESLYNPIHYYLLGSFNILSVNYIDNFHFGNFNFGPHAKHLNADAFEYDMFNYQITNGSKVEILGDQMSLSDIGEKYNFTALIKLKINSELILNNNVSVIEGIKDLIKTKILGNDSTKIILSESFSWHELTVNCFSENISNLFKIVKELRKFKHTDLDEKYISNSYVFKCNDRTTKESVSHIFADTKSFYGFKKGAGIGKDEDNINFRTHFHIHTGHFNKVNRIIKDILKVDELSFDCMPGKNDFCLSLNYKDFFNFINEIINGNMKKAEELSKHIRSIQTVVYESIDVEYDEADYLTKMHQENIYEKIAYSRKEIRAVSETAQRLKLPKNLRRRLLGLLVNFNNAIKDRNLYLYHLEIYPLVKNIIERLNQVSSPSSYELKGKTIHNIRSIAYQTEFLDSQINLFKTAFQNRYQESKKLDEDTDIKMEFNGGVHQIISTYDLIYKLIDETIAINFEKGISDNLPTATFGSVYPGITSMSNRVNINYFHLFQPEFFLSVVFKEASNYYFEKVWFENSQDKSVFKSLVDLINSTTKTLSLKLHKETNLKQKSLFFSYLRPHELNKRINYITSYFLQYKMLYIGETKQESEKLFTFWYWHNFFQSSIYNIDGSIRTRTLKLALFTYIGTIYVMHNKKIDIEKIKVLISENIKHFNIPFLCNKFLEEAVEVFEWALEDKDFSRCLENIEKSINIIDKLVDNRGEQTYKKFIKISNDYLQWLKNEILKYSSSQTILIRNNENGNRISLNGDNEDYKNSLYSRGAFDPQGGLFVIEPKFRKDYYNKRIEVFGELRTLAWEYRNQYFNKLLKERTK